MVRPERVELPTFWFVAIEAGNPNSFVCVAYGYHRSTPGSLNVRKLSVAIRRSTIPFRSDFRTIPRLRLIELGAAMWHGG